VKFWDTSAVVPLCVIEASTGTVKSILTRDPSIVVWWATRTECVSALIRQTREGSLRIEDERQARQVLRQLGDAWTEVQPSEILRETAERLLAVHALRAADASQLAAALHWCQRQTEHRELVSFDTRLRDAAYKEGFTILPAQIH
jgi:predicted nucleic acid-binding protein